MFLLILLLGSTPTSCTLTYINSSQDGQSHIWSGMTSRSQGQGISRYSEEDHWAGIYIGVEHEEEHRHHHIHELVWSDFENCLATGKSCVPGTSLCCDPNSKNPNKELCNKIVKKCVKEYPSLGDACSREYRKCAGTDTPGENEILCLPQKGDEDNLICEEIKCISQAGKECNKRLPNGERDEKTKCCNTLACVKGKCKDCRRGGADCHCKTPGQSCYNRDDCCDKFNNVCRIVRKSDSATNTNPGDCGPCAKTAGKCKTSADCCDKNDRCSGNTQKGDTRFCLTCGFKGVTPFCDGHDDCCPEMACRKGVCKVCKLRGKPCSNSDECCSDAPMCRAGQCNTCIAPNAFVYTTKKTYARFGCEKPSDCCFEGNVCFTYLGGHKGCAWPKGCLPQYDPGKFKHKHCTWRNKCCPGCECKDFDGKLFHKGTYCDCKRRG